MRRRQVGFTYLSDAPRSSAFDRQLFCTQVYQPSTLNKGVCHVMMIIVQIVIILLLKSK